MKKILFIISIILIISLVLSSCANKAGEAQKGTETESESNVPSEEFHPIIDAFADRPKLAKSDFKPLSEIVFESDYERVAFDYVVNYEKTFTGAKDEFDVYANTIGSLSAEEKSRVIEDIIQKDLKADVAQIEDLNDFLAFCLKRQQTTYPQSYNSLPVINYGCDACVLHSRGNEYIACIEMRLYEHFNYIDSPDKYADEGIYYVIYLYKYGDTWLIYNVVSNDYWRRECYRGGDYDQLYEELVEPKE